MKSGLILAVMACSLIFSGTIRADTFTVKIRPGNPGVKVSIKTMSANNPYPGSGGRIALFVHGLAHTGISWQNMVNELFANPPNGVRIKKVIVVNMPNRGGSGLPYGDCVKFGELDIDDYAEVLIGTLKHFEGSNSEPTIIVGHSMGGLVIQSSQEHLLSKGTSLREKYNIGNVILLASASPSAVLDPFLESGAGLGLLSFYTFNNPSLGDFVSIDEESFLFFFFSNFNGEFAPGTPTPVELNSLGYKADESLAAAIQTVGTADLRPIVRPNIFTETTGTRCFVMVGNNDQFNDPAQHQALYEYLTGDPTLSGFRLIDGEFAVHDQYITDPAAIIDAFEGM